MGATISNGPGVGHCPSRTGYPYPAPAKPANNTGVSDAVSSRHCRPTALEPATLNPYRPVIHVIDDDPGVRRSLALWLGFRDHVTREYDSAEAFLGSVDARSQGCAIIDVHLGGMSGLELQARMAEAGVALPALFLTGHGDVPTVRAALKAGAFDFLEKPVENDRLVELVEAALRSDERRWEALQQSERVQERLERLTPREREVMERVVAGRHNREIAVEMGISARTVEVYKARLMDKLDVRRVADLVRFAMRQNPAAPSGPQGHDR